MPSLGGAHSEAQGEEQSLPGILRKASKDGAAWVRAEAALAQAEIVEASKRALIALALAILGGSVALAALVVTALGIIALIAPLVGGLFAATAIVGVALIICAALIAWWAWRVAVSTAEATTFVTRWREALLAKKRGRT